MSKIIFVGSKLDGYFAEEVARLRGYDYECIPKNGNIKDQTNDILFAASGTAEYIIFDVEQYINTADEIAKEISAIAAASNAKPIIYAPAFIPESQMARSLYNLDIKRFVVSGSATSLKDQLEKNMAGFYDANERDEVEAIKEIEEEEKLNVASFSTIGVAGVCHRIGTTTQAIQIVKYLNLKGYKACYIDLNENKYVDFSRTTGERKEIGFTEKVASWFDLEKKDDAIGMVSYSGVDMFYNHHQIPEVLKMGYDYYVYDYGVYTDQQFNKTSFVREDLKIFVVGSSPTELDYTLDVAENLFYSDSKILFSFTDAGERDELGELVEQIKEGNRQRAFFANYVPDMFTLMEIDQLEKMLPIDDAAGTEEVVKKKKGFFRKKG